jgi:peptidoglycan hydrolase-like protein with peptidoglycan-binding domain
VQSQGDLGTNVAVIQTLLRAHGASLTVDGIFGSSTTAAVAAFKGTHGLYPNGIVTAQTWTALVVPVKYGSTGEAVNAVKRLLNAKRGTALKLDGKFGTGTRDAVAAFQRHYGMTVWGSVGPVTWRRLVAHFEYPTFAHGLCDYSVGNGRANWGTSAAIAELEVAAAAFAKLGHGGVALGDASYEHGGDIPGHTFHEQGLDVDIRPIRVHENQCTYGTDLRSSSYDRDATRQLLEAIKAASPSHVKWIYFNDPVFIDEGLTIRYPGHDDHLHVTYCEVIHPVSRYVC